MRTFLKDENGNITVSFALLTPFIIIYALWIVSTWQAMYVQNQTKAVIDFALLGGATTGVAEKSEATNSIAGCYIPVVGGQYGDDIDEYGANIAFNLLVENAKNTLPSSIALQLEDQAKDYWMNPDEINLQNGGMMHFKVENMKYRTLVPVLVDNWNFTIESTARCQPK